MSNQNVTPSRADIEQRIAHIDRQQDMTAREIESLKEQLARAEEWSQQQQALRDSYVEFLAKVAE